MHFGNFFVQSSNIFCRIFLITFAFPKLEFLDGIAPRKVFTSVQLCVTNVTRLYKLKLETAWIKILSR